jgi:DNA-binding transcriptional MerR regulator
MFPMTIGQLASHCKVARTTILYYEQVGLLAPAIRSEGGHRQYGEQDLARVGQICAWRATGMTLDAIRALLAGGDEQAAIVLRLQTIERAMARLREQQALLAALLGRVAASPPLPAPAPAPAPFEALYQEQGLDDAAMHRWHVVFARQNPEGHKAFLLALGLSEQDVARIARDSASAG